MTAEQVLVVVVLYSDKDEPCISLKTLMAHPEAPKMAWLIWDNHPLPDMLPQLENWMSESAPLGGVRWHYEAHPDNPGLSHAYLSASDKGIALGCTWMLMVDQDTHFPADWWDVYSRSVNEEPTGLLVPQLYSAGMCISPAVHGMGISRPNPRPIAGEINLYRYMPVNSGMMIRIADYKRCGGHLPWVRLDFSDTAFIYRLRATGTRAMVVPVVCKHGLSGLEPGSYAVRLKRFGQYCRDARAWAKTEGPVVHLTFLATARALRLSFRYLRFGFMSVLLQQFIMGKPR
jgi:GT2 family glycosyltransferase